MAKKKKKKNVTGHLWGTVGINFRGQQVEELRWMWLGQGDGCGEHRASHHEAEIW